MSGTNTIDLLGPFSDASLRIAASPVVSDAEKQRPTSLNLRGETVTRGVVTEVLVYIAVRQSLSSKDSWDLFIANHFKSVASVLGIFRERWDDALKFYIITQDESAKDLELLFDIEKNVYQIFPHDDLDFEVLLGEEMESALPSAAVNIWRRAH